jgi:hypothetical protein
MPSNCYAAAANVSRAVQAFAARGISGNGGIDAYSGTPFHDGRHQGGAQPIPGRVECAYYDLGGEGVAYHDTDERNHGSGELNPADGSYRNEFRRHEGVDTSYMKYHDAIDNNPYEEIRPQEDQLYVGGTEPGEWFRITVHVKRAGTYAADLLYTSNRGGSIGFDLDGKPQGAPIAIASTYNTADPIAWRQWHHWRLTRQLIKLQLPQGTTVLTVHIVTGGNMNLAYFDFHGAR